MQEEIWKDIPEYEGLYQVSNLGNVKSIRFKTKHLIKKHVVTNGYNRLCLNKNGISKSFYVHRLVGIAFIKNNENKKCINHKNGIRTDNSVLNLEWVTHKENENHKRLVLGYTVKDETKIKMSESQKGRIFTKEHKDSISKNNAFIKKVYCINTGKVWESIKLCAIDLNISYPQLRKSLINKNNLNKNIKYFNYENTQY